MFRHLKEAGHRGSLCAKVRKQTEFLTTTLRRLRNATGRSIRSALETTLREFQAAGGFLLVPREWWPDYECHSEFPYWFKVPVDIEKQSPSQAPALELVAVDLWGNEVVCTRCKVARCEARRLHLCGSRKNLEAAEKQDCYAFETSPDASRSYTAT